MARVKKDECKPFRQPVWAAYNSMSGRRARIMSGSAVTPLAGRSKRPGKLDAETAAGCRKHDVRYAALSNIVRWGAAVGSFRQISDAAIMSSYCAARFEAQCEADEGWTRSDSPAEGCGQGR